MPDKQLVCPECRHEEFTWTVKVTEYGGYIESERDSRLPDPTGRGERVETHTGERRDIHCLGCGTVLREIDLVRKMDNDAQHG